MAWEGYTLKILFIRVPIDLGPPLICLSDMFDVHFTRIVTLNSSLFPLINKKEQEAEILFLLVCCSKAFMKKKKMLMIHIQVEPSYTQKITLKKYILIC